MGGSRYTTTTVESGASWSDGGPLATRQLQQVAPAETLDACRVAWQLIRHPRPGRAATRSVSSSPVLGPAEPYCSPSSCPSRFRLAVARVGCSDQGIDESPRGSGNFLDGAIKRFAVSLGRAVEPAEFPDKLEGRGSNLFVRRGWLKIKQRLDVSAHDLKLRLGAFSLLGSLPVCPLPHARIDGSRYAIDPGQWDLEPHGSPSGRQRGLGAA